MCIRVLIESTKLFKKRLRNVVLSILQHDSESKLARLNASEHINWRMNCIRPSSPALNKNGELAIYDSFVIKCDD